MSRLALRKSITDKHELYGFRPKTLDACLKAASDAFEKRLKFSDQAAA